MVNDAGGVKGNKINLIEQDDAYNVAKEVGIVKSFINDDHVALVTGIGNSSGFSSILPLLNASKTPALVNQGTLKTNTYPFQPYMFQGNCNYGDQAEVSLAYTMARAKIKSLKGVKVGIAGIAVASGQEWIDTLKEKVEKAGGIPVTQTLPAAIVNADVAAQAFQDAGVKLILMHHSIAGGIAMERSIAKYGINVPVSGSYGVTQDLLWTTAPYEATKNFVGTNCYTPLVDSKSPQGKLALAMGKKYGVSSDSLAQTNYVLGWVNGAIITTALKSIKGAVTPATMKRGLETVKNLNMGDLSPVINLTPKCHMAIQQVRPMDYSFNLKKQIPVGTYAQWSKYITNTQAAPGTCGKPRTGK
jgi:ABC-type branched-subunit amino acid transport system substrate-binding protein